MKYNFSKLIFPCFDVRFIEYSELIIPTFHLFLIKPLAIILLAILTPETGGGKGPINNIFFFINFRLNQSLALFLQ